MSPPSESRKTTVQENSLHEQAHNNTGEILEGHAQDHIGQATPLQHVDLVTPDVADAPPAYSNIYGEIHTEKDGLDTSASVTDDGRVNIHINQLNRRLSQIFTTPLDQHIREAEDSERTAAEINASSQKARRDGSVPPPLNVVIQVVGSRGDVQPFVALGKVLKASYGHRVRLATHPVFKDFVEEHGLEFFSIGGDPTRLMAFMVKNPGLRPGFRSIANGDIGQRRRDVAEYIQGCWRSCYQAGDGMSDTVPEQPSINSDKAGSTARPFVADCIIANPPSFAHIHCAQKLGVPLHIMFTMPYSPTQAFSHPLANIQSSNADPQLTNYISYAMIELLSWQALGDIINRFRSKCLGLDPVSRFWGPGTLQRLRIPHTYCWSPALIPKPRDWGSHISISGFYFLKAPDYTPDAKLLEFLNKGPPPVYIGFGSIVLSDPNAMTELIFEAAKASNQRVLLSKGWGGMGADELHVPDNVFMLGNVPHDWLFQHVSCVVHHGGAGTTAAGIAAGRPTLIVPFFGDQPFWGAMIARAGAGPEPIPHKQLTAAKLADAITFCLRTQTSERAQELASKIAEEKGCDMGADAFHEHLQPERLRCALSPSRASVWRIKRTEVGLSAFAACTLVNADLLDYQDLKLFRAEEHYIDEGPRDPISGGFTASVGAFTGMAMGLADIPSETWRAMNVPGEHSRQKSRASSSTDLGSVPGSHARNPSISSKTSTNNGTDAEAQEPPSQTRKLFTRSKTMPTHSPQDPSPARSPLSTNNSLDPAEQAGKQADMMQPTGVHVSRGAGRFAKSLLQGPIDISVNLTRGMHNVPKLWGDTTVRPQERVTDFRSGMKAVGREFGFGFYDGLGGLVTQPWKGAKEDGASGFFKGVGKGIGGFVPKTGAACLGILSHTMQGVSKEVQKLFGSDVGGYIVAARVAQGYEEWSGSSEEEREDVIVGWKMLRKGLKGKGRAGDVSRDAEGARGKVVGNEESGRRSESYSKGSVSSSFDGPERVPENGEDRSNTTETAPSPSHTQPLVASQPLHPLQTTSHHQPDEAPAIPSSSRTDDRHLAGVTRSEFEASQATAGEREKTTQEKNEEQIVLEYIKKQSLLEKSHREKREETAEEMDAQEEEDLRRALEASMR